MDKILTNMEFCDKTIFFKKALHEEDFWQKKHSENIVEYKGWPKKNLTDQILYSSYLDSRWSDLQNVGVYPP